MKTILNYLTKFWFFIFGINKKRTISKKVEPNEENTPKHITKRSFAYHKPAWNPPIFTPKRQKIKSWQKQKTTFNKNR